MFRVMKAVRAVSFHVALLLPSHAPGRDQEEADGVRRTPLRQRLALQVTVEAGEVFDLGHAASCLRRYQRE